MSIQALLLCSVLAIRLVLADVGDPFPGCPALEDGTKAVVITSSSSGDICKCTACFSNGCDPSVTFPAPGKPYNLASM